MKETFEIELGEYEHKALCEVRIEWEAEHCAIEAWVDGVKYRNAELLLHKLSAIGAKSKEIMEHIDKTVAEMKVRASRPGK